MKNENPNPGSIKWWLTLIIAVLTAIVSTLGTTAANACGLMP